MADLSTLDPTQPDGSVIPVSQLDDFDRETRKKLKDWALVQHDIHGFHTIPMGSTAARTAYYTSPVNGNPWIVIVGTVYTLTVFNGGSWHNVL